MSELGWWVGMNWVVGGARGGVGWGGLWWRLGGNGWLCAASLALSSFPALLAQWSRAKKSDVLVIGLLWKISLIPYPSMPDLKSHPLTSIASACRAIGNGGCNQCRRSCWKQSWESTNSYAKNVCLWIDTATMMLYIHVHGVTCRGIPKTCISYIVVDTNTSRVCVGPYQPTQ